MTLARTNFHAVRYVNSSSCLVTIKGIQPTTNQHGKPHAYRCGRFARFYSGVSVTTSVEKNCSSRSRHG